MQSWASTHNAAIYCVLSQGLALLAIPLMFNEGFPGGPLVKNLPTDGGDAGLILGLEDPLEKKIITYSSILASEIPWIEELGGL